MGGTSTSDTMQHEFDFCQVWTIIVKLWPTSAVQCVQHRVQSLHIHAQYTTTIAVWLKSQWTNGASGYKVETSWTMLMTTNKGSTTTIWVHETKDNTIGMTQKTNIKLPTPTHFDGRIPHFNEWAGEVKAT
eukprot:5026440-Amphidinium_carterae.1